MLSEKQEKALQALLYIVSTCLKKRAFTFSDLDKILVCVPDLLESPGFVRRFIGWLGRMATLPDVLKEAGMWAWALKKFSNVVGKW